MRRYLFAAILIAVAAVWLIVRQDIPERSAAVETARLNRDLPEITVKPLSGGDPRSLSEEVVGVTVINVFASWCAPCRAEHPALMALNRDGVRVVGVAVRDTTPAAQAFLTELGDPFARTVLDVEGEADAALSLNGGIPATFVVDSDGRLLMRRDGPLVGTDGEEALAEIRRLSARR